MAETDILSPNQSQKQRLPRIQSPTSPFFLASNDDQLERAQARAARSAAIRRKSVASASHALQPLENPDSCLDKQYILDLFHNCIKLASENKINQKNTWELNLIDHLCEIVKVEEEDTETNFQKASCTLEAGVKIYSLRVDSVHSEAYKVLGGINRAGQENEQDAALEDANVDIGQDVHFKKEKQREISPLSTLEPSFEALNAKKFDVAFAVDPLYHQTSAQFDEGGAKGLLLNNLGVYGSCRVLFDSQEIPGKFMCENKHEISDMIDLSFARDYIEQMVRNMQTKDEISPTLENIISQFDDDNRRPLDTFTSCHKVGDLTDKDNAVYDNEVEIDDEVAENCGTWNFGYEDQESVVDKDLDPVNISFPFHQEENASSSFHHADMDDGFENVDSYLFLNLGFSSNHNAWAGPDHWKYHKTKGSKNNFNAEREPPVTTRRAKSKKKAELDIDFMKALEGEMPDIFTPPRNPRSLLLPANRAPCNNKLPEDCHYQPEDLVKLFLLPNKMCIRKRREKVSDGSRQQYDDCGPVPCWDDGNEFGGQFDDGIAYSDAEDSNTLVSHPRQVKKIEVTYDKTSKQVDVQALKETLWHHIQGSPHLSVQDQEEALSFRDLLANFPGDCTAAATINDISPHLCFICLLHLANEHGLSIHSCARLDDLNIHVSFNDLIMKRNEIKV